MWDEYDQSRQPAHYKMVEIRNGQVTKTLELESIKVIPADSFLLFTVPPETSDADFQVIKEQIRHHFQNTRSALIRDGDIGVQAVSGLWWFQFKYWLLKLLGRLTNGKNFG